MAQERIILDPAEMVTGRTEVELTDWVGEAGIDWGEGANSPYYAEAELGQSVLGYRYDNRQISAGLVLQARGGTSFATIRSTLQAKAALYQREGGIGKRITASGGTVYFDVVTSGLTLSGGWLQAHQEADTDAEIRLEAIPDFYEPEVELTSAEEKTAAELIKVIPDPGGDMPARVRIVVEEKQGQNQLGLIWALRSRHYSSAVTAKPAYEAEELQTLDAARKVALSGASGGTVVQHGTISTSWTPIVGGRLGGTAWQTHTGTNRIFARLYSTSGTLAQARLVWDVGDLVNPVENAAYRLPGASNFYIADLGEVRLDKAPVGTHRWDWQIQAKGDVGTEDFKVDKVWIVNADEGMGRLTASSALGMSPSGFAAQDTFTQSAGTLTGKTALRGGVWSGAGDADDFTIDTTNHRAQRTALSDVAGTPHYALLGTTKYTDIVTKVRVGSTNPYELGEGPNSHLGIIARYVDVNNHIQAYLYQAGVEGAGPGFVKTLWVLAVWKKVAGVKKALIEAVGFDDNRTAVASGVNGTPIAADIELVVLSDGRWRVGASGKTLKIGRDSDLSSVGALKEGLIGIVDERSSAAPAETRTYDNFEAWVPIYDTVTYASKSAQLGTGGMYRLDSGGSAYGPVSRVIGDLPRLPAGGLEDRPSELFLKATQGDLGELPDSAMDDIAVKVFASRSWLTGPGTI